MIKIFIYYEEFQPLAFHIASQSIIEFSSEPVSIIPIDARNFIKNYNFSPSMISSIRFTPPFLSDFNGWAIFIDGSCMFQQDPVRLIEEIKEKEDKLSAKEKHGIFVRNNTKSLEAQNVIQELQSVIVFNCAQLRYMTLDYIKEKFAESSDSMMTLVKSRIGEFDWKWNVLAQYEKHHEACLLNFAAGLPVFFPIREGLGVETFAQIYDKITAVTMSWKEIYGGTIHEAMVNNKYVPRFMVDMQSCKPRQAYSEYVYNLLSKES